MMEFFAPGVPAPQGSKNPWGGEAAKGLKPWRETVIIAAHNCPEQQVFFGPVLAHLTFVFPRPKSHYGTGRNAETLKPSAPLWKTSAPDIDKLERAVLDALTQSGVLRDDAIVCDLHASKLYGDRPGVEVMITHA